MQSINQPHQLKIGLFRGFRLPVQDTTTWSQLTRASAMQSREEADRLLAEATRKHGEARQIHADAHARAAAIDAKVEAVKSQFRDAHRVLMAAVEAL
jgi:hypothetical protein